MCGHCSQHPRRGRNGLHSQLQQLVESKEYLKTRSICDESTSFKFRRDSVIRKTFFFSRRIGKDNWLRMHWRKYQYPVVDLTISKSRPLQLVTLTQPVTTAPATPSYGRAACERFPSSGEIELQISLSSCREQRNEDGIQTASHFWRAHHKHRVKITHFNARW